MLHFFKERDTCTPPFDTLTSLSYLPGTASGYDGCQTRLTLACIFRGTSRVETNIYYPQATLPFTPGELVFLRFSAPKECRSECVQEGSPNARDDPVHEWRTL